MIRTAFAGMSSPVRILFFACMVVAGMGASATLILSAAGWLWGLDAEAVQALAATPSSPHGRTLHWTLNGVNQLLSFGLASWAFVWLFGRMPRMQAQRPSLVLWSIAALLIGFFAGSLADLVARFDHFLSDLTPWAEQFAAMETKAAAITIELLSFTSPWEFLLALAIVAVLPAICEEWAFRGVTQQHLIRWTGKIAVPIVLTAIQFSILHLQPHGFFARIFLGAVYGVLTVLSGSLVPAMLAHFVNNAAMVIKAYVFGPEWVSDVMQPGPSSPVDPVELTISVAVLAAVVVYLWKSGVRWSPRARAYMEATRRLSRDAGVSGPPGGTPAPR